jgi:hypothetical protein
VKLDALLIRQLARALRTEVLPVLSEQDEYVAGQVFSTYSILRYTAALQADSEESSSRREEDARRLLRDFAAELRACGEREAASRLEVRAGHARELPTEEARSLLEEASFVLREVASRIPGAVTHRVRRELRSTIRRHHEEMIDQLIRS